MGRTKIPMNYIDNDKSRKITKRKRKNGVIKKVFELSKLTGIKIALIFVDKEANKTTQIYTDENFKEIFDSIDDENSEVYVGHEEIVDGFKVGDKESLPNNPKEEQKLKNHKLKKFCNDITKDIGNLKIQYTEDEINKIFYQK